MKKYLIILLTFQHTYVIIIIEIRKGMNKMKKYASWIIRKRWGRGFKVKQIGIYVEPNVELNKKTVHILYQGVYLGYIVLNDWDNIENNVDLTKCGLQGYEIWSVDYSQDI